MKKMSQKKEELIVIFRMEKGNNPFGDPLMETPLALFPEINHDRQGKQCVCYAHHGQHMPADYTGTIAETRPAKPSEYKELLQELKSIGYGKNEKLVIKQRYTKRR